MFGSRRLAKRSIIGTRVCAPWTDGKYYPGVIQSTQTWPNGEEVYTVSFDGGFNKVVQDKDLIGPGFQTIMSTKLKKGQKVFITYNGREVSGMVEHHDVAEDNVFIAMDLPSSEDIEIDRKLEEVRLLPSRKSSRLQKQDTDYCKMADMPSGDSKKRAVSHVIDVPTPVAKQSRRRKSTPSPEPDIMQYDEEEAMEAEVEEELVEEEVGKAGKPGEVMDEHMAAMVLTALSCSPVSPSFPPNITEKSSSPAAEASSYSSSGVWGMKGDSRTPSLGTPSPPQLSTSAPSVGTLFGTPPVDEGIDLDETSAYFADDVAPRKRRASTRTVFKCTWPSCGKLYNTTNGIERHVRCEHLGPRSSDEDDLSDHEEEFYYTELEVTVDTMTETFADMYTSSPPAASFLLPHPPVPAAPNVAVASLPDHDYQKKVSAGVHGCAVLTCAAGSVDGMKYERCETNNASTLDVWPLIVAAREVLLKECGQLIEGCKKPAEIVDDDCAKSDCDRSDICDISLLPSVCDISDSACSSSNFDDDSHITMRSGRSSSSSGLGSSRGTSPRSSCSSSQQSSRSASPVGVPVYAAIYLDHNYATCYPTPVISEAKDKISNSERNKKVKKRKRLLSETERTNRRKKRCAKKESIPLSIPQSSSEHSSVAGGSYPGSLSINIPQLSRSLSWQAPSNKMSKPSPSNKSLSQSNPKSSPLHKKTRSDTKKCRKVYGMENRDMWCTQCKWKKACTRFMD